MIHVHVIDNMAKENAEQHYMHHTSHKSTTYIYHIVGNFGELLNLVIDKFNVFENHQINKLYTCTPMMLSKKLNSINTK